MAECSQIATDEVIQRRLDFLDIMEFPSIRG